jgi:hypothetical protein
VLAGPDLEFTGGYTSNKREKFAKTDFVRLPNVPQWDSSDVRT